SPTCRATRPRSPSSSRARRSPPTCGRPSTRSRRRSSRRRRSPRKAGEAAMAKPANGTIIIKRIKKGDHGGHHGGASKAAYAAFVTAMMAFFLLLWLLNVTTDVQKHGIADYFEPTISLKQASSGADGILGGRVIGDPGAMTRSAAAPSLALPVPSLRQPDEGDEGNDSGAPGMAETRKDPRADRLDDVAKLREEAQRDPSKLNDPEFQKKLAEVEEHQFAAAEFALRQA